ncbi:ion channel [Yoonia sp. R2331]|uniref:ion channel n=1 Tax=Yoonia sp. R2331 TaxID=3237238 RepID=UPI0034E54E97
MLVQIVLGAGLLLVSIMIAGVSFWAMDRVLLRVRPWLMRAPHAPKLLAVLVTTAVWILAQLTVGVWLWALTFVALDIFATLEEAVYFALVVFTTLGFGDILLPVEWRLLGGMASLNGLLNIGLVTAVLVETMRQIRLNQMEQGS